MKTIGFALQIIMAVVLGIFGGLFYLVERTCAVVIIALDEIVRGGEQP